TGGCAGGGAVVCGQLGDVVVEGEGIETVWSAVECGASGIATLSASTLGRVPLPKAVTRVIILGERGSEPAADAAARLRHAEGRTVYIVYTPAPHKDLNDVLRAEGPSVVEKLFNEATPWEPLAEETPEQETEEAVNFERPDDKPRWLVDMTRRDEVVTSVAELLESEPTLYERGVVVQVVEDRVAGEPVARPVTPDVVAH